MATKDVAKDALKKITRAQVGKDLDRRLHDCVVAAHIVESKGMVDMVVGEEDRINTLEPEAKALRAMIRTAVEEDNAIMAVFIAKEQRRA